MGDPSARPDPDALLRRVQKEEAQGKRGKLKIFFGFAPGVGKTYRMLQVARDLVADQKLDVVVGFVETHGRRETAALMLGLELLPRAKLEYRGRLLEELDLDAALRRRPALILVDELAHTNVEGCRHPKRWQDVEELLEAGIDVFSTMNVQHVESLNDIIAQITRVEVRETVPDAVLDDADSIELVDIAPEELLQRLKEGKVYLAAQAQRAVDHFFQRGNLLALRELALRRTAQHVDEDVLEYRAEHGVSATWPAGERVLVCVGPAPSSGRLIRAAARIAAGLRCPWVAAYVESPNLAGLGDADGARLETHLRLAESLGATLTRLSGLSIAETLLGYARKHNVTRIVFGKPTHARWRDRLRGSLLDDIVRGSGDIDVQVISGDGSEDAAPRPQVARKLPFEATKYVLAAGLIGIALGIGLVVEMTLELPDLEMVFLVAVILSGIWLGRGPSLLAALLGVLCYDYFFVQPLYEVSVMDRRYILTFAMMFIVSFVMSELAGRLRRQERGAAAREERTTVLYALTKELAATDVPARIAATAARHASESFNAQAFVLAATRDDELVPLGAFPEGEALGPKELGVAEWAQAHDDLAGRGTDTLPGSDILCAPLRVSHVRLGVLALMPRERTPLSADQRAFLDVFSRQVAVALERARLAAEARSAALRAKTEEMRASLLSAVSHDLRTPLASITGAATAMRDDPKLSADTRSELIEAIVEEAGRLERLVGNLLDMTRLESGAVSLHRDWVPLDEIVSSALTRLEERLAERPVLVDMPEGLPLLWVDPVLFEQLFVNLLENADKYTPARSPIEIRARANPTSVAIEVVDHGPGIPAGSEEEIFEKFFRGSHSGRPGVGLGLPICRGIVDAHGGSIRALSQPGGGAHFHVSVPIGGRPPSVSALGASNE